jgi:hypothetical protein
VVCAISTRRKISDVSEIAPTIAESIEVALATCRAGRVTLGFESMVKGRRDWEFVPGELRDGCTARE